MNIIFDFITKKVRAFKNNTIVIRDTIYTIEMVQNVFVKSIGASFEYHSIE